MNYLDTLDPKDKEYILNHVMEKFNSMSAAEKQNLINFYIQIEKLKGGVNNGQYEK